MSTERMSENSVKFFSKALCSRRGGAYFFETRKLVERSLAPNPRQGRVAGAQILRRAVSTHDLHDKETQNKGEDVSNVTAVSKRRNIDRVLHLVDQLVGLQSGQLLGPHQQRLGMKIEPNLLRNLVHLHRLTQSIQEGQELEKFAMKSALKSMLHGK